MPPKKTQRDKLPGKGKPTGKGKTLAGRGRGNQVDSSSEEDGAEASFYSTIVPTTFNSKVGKISKLPVKAPVEAPPKLSKQERQVQKSTSTPVITDDTDDDNHSVGSMVQSIAGSDDDLTSGQQPKLKKAKKVKVPLTPNQEQEVAD